MHCFGDGAGLVMVVDDGVVQRAMGFHVGHRRPGDVCECLQGADLIDDVGRQVGRFDVDEPPAEPGKVAVADLGPDPHTVARGLLAAVAQRGRVARVKPACDVGACDKAEHGVVVTELPRAEALPEVSVDVDGDHGASLDGTLEM